MILRRRPPVAALVCALFSLAAGTMTADPSPAVSPRPISASVARVVEQLEARRKDPCLEAHRQGRPCFPAETALPGPTASVRESLGLLGPKDAWSPGRPPTQAEMAPYRPGPPRSLTPNVVSVTVDPGCLGKSALRKLKGKNDTYYLYRIRGPQGERMALYDRRIDATTFQGEAEFLGKFEGECAAVAALCHEERK